MHLGCAIAAALCAAGESCAVPAGADAGNITAPFKLALGSSVSAGQPPDEHHEGGHGHTHDHEFAHLPAGLGAKLFEGWLDPWRHSDYSRGGTPFVHLFLSEPAYIDRDVFLDFAVLSGDEGEEYEAVVEVELPLTRRIGLVVEAPYHFINPEHGESESGLGDMALAPRFLLLDYERFLLSANIEVEFPSGDEDRGLGTGDYILGPSLAAWVDLRHNFTLQATIGLEHRFGSDLNTMVWSAALTYSFYLLGDPEIMTGDGAVRAHFPVGMLSLIAEMRGEHPLDGPDEGSGTAMGVLGASYTFAPQLELRAGVAFPAWRPREFDIGAVFGLIYHF